MATAIIVYVICSMGLGSLVAHLHRHTLPPSSAPLSHYFSLALLRMLVLGVFLYMTYPVLFNLIDAGYTPRASALWLPLANVVASVILMTSSILLLTWIAQYSPFPPAVLLLQGIVIATWLFSRVADTGNSGIGLFPDWQFVASTLILYGACALIAEALIWLIKPTTSPDQQSVLTELARAAATLPALLIYCLGLGAGL